MFALAFIAMLGFVTTPPTSYVKTFPNGTVMHVDEDTAPICGVRGPWAGCAKIIDGVKHIWVSGVAVDGVVQQHEEKHLADGGKDVQHGPAYWHRYFGKNCMDITKGDGDKYLTGGIVCINDKGRERVIPPGYQDEDCMECRVPGPNPPMAPHPFFKG